MKMSAPAPDWTAAVIRGCRSLALIVSSVTSAPRALEASGIWRFSSTSASGMKSTQRTRWSLVPWAKAGARRAARMPSMPPASVAAAPAVLMKVRRSTWVAAVSFESGLLMIGSSLTGEPSVAWWRSAAPQVRELSRRGGRPGCEVETS